MSFRFPRRAPAEVLAARPLAVDPDTLAVARTIVDDVREGGEAALRRHAERLGDLEPGQPLLLRREELQRERERADPEVLALLERTADRIAAFARAQRGALVDVELALPGARAGHRVRPVRAAGCYAPGGRYPLPSSVLMTAVTARVAGVPEVWVASPRPGPVQRLAAAVAGADGLLCVGGAQAVAALALGAGLPACDVIVGPGNRFVTAAKQLLAGTVGIDMLAGPSELLVLAGPDCEAARVAADLLAQAEHDPDARALLVALDEDTLLRVELAIEDQLADLPTSDVARLALSGSFAVPCTTVDEALAVADALAPEHLALHGAAFEARAPDLACYGALFVGSSAAEVLGDYGAGPNHVLPTGGGGRHRGGLSVLDFLRVQTWLTVDDERAAHQLAQDAATLARLEGLEAHARSAEQRLPPATRPSGPA